MKREFIKLNEQMGMEEYLMYQDILSDGIRAVNILLGVSYSDFKEKLAELIKEEDVINEKIGSTTNRYILYISGKPVGEFGIRTTINDFWSNQGSQIFYKIRESEQGKGYGNIILKCGLEECRKIGMKQVRANCDEKNIPSNRMIIKCGGVLDKKSSASYGINNSYVIKL